MGKALVFLLTICLVWSCVQPLIEPSGSADLFFDFSDFLDSLSEHSDKKTVSKSIIWRGQKESKKIENYHWISDLQKFEDFDLNSNSLYEKYAVDSLVGGFGDLQSITYRAIDPKTEVKFFKVVFEENEIDSILIKHFRESFIASTETQLLILPQIGYELGLIEEGLFRDLSESEITLRVESP
jgi:hypothetical protein